MVPWLANGLRQVDLGPGTGFLEHPCGVSAELAPTDQVWPEDVDEAYKNAMVSIIQT